MGFFFCFFLCLFVCFFNDNVINSERNSVTGRPISMGTPVYCVHSVASTSGCSTAQHTNTRGLRKAEKGVTMSSAGAVSHAHSLKLTHRHRHEPFQPPTSEAVFNQTATLPPSMDVSFPFVEVCELSRRQCRSGWKVFHPHFIIRPTNTHCPHRVHVTNERLSYTRPGLCRAVKEKEQLPLCHAQLSIKCLTHYTDGSHMRYQRKLYAPGTLVVRVWFALGAL